MCAMHSSALLALSVIVGCSQHHSVSIAVLPVPPPVPIQRTLIEAPPPSMIPVPPLPALKPGTEYSLAQSEALANQPPPKAPLEPQVTASQRAMGRKVVHVANGAAVGVEALPTDVSHLVGLSQADTMKLFGPPMAPKSFPPYQVWTYHSTNCDLMLFFFPEVSGTAFRALTYQIIERDASDATHTACLASLIMLPATPAT
ncbi:MAG TPA: hypothetical protein VL418_12390 [Devosiaceae bacterium]|jgi:hypothetical protein|nr:hypothetical protein [Devosiaceae bacterium]